MRDIVILLVIALIGANSIDNSIEEKIHMENLADALASTELDLASFVIAEVEADAESEKKSHASEDEDDDDDDEDDE